MIGEILSGARAFGGGIVGGSLLFSLIEIISFRYTNKLNMTRMMLHGYRIEILTRLTLIGFGILSVSQLGLLLTK